MESAMLITVKEFRKWGRSNRRRGMLAGFLIGTFIYEAARPELAKVLIRVQDFNDRKAQERKGK